MRLMLNSVVKAMGELFSEKVTLVGDSLVAVTMVLNRMSQSENSLSSIYKTLPQYKIVKDRINIENG